LYVDSAVSQEYLNQIYEPESRESVLDATGGMSHDHMVGLRMAEFEKHWADLKAARPFKRGDKLLDFGCQTGEMGSVAARDGVVPNGIELSRDYAQLCQSTWGAASKVHNGSLFEAPFAREEFQYITAFEVLEHMLDPIGALTKLREWLAPDGVLAISVPSSDYFHFKFWLLRTSILAKVFRPIAEHYAEFYKHQVLPHSHIYNFSEKSVGMLMERGGFEPVAVGLTGWHGRFGRVFDRAGRALELASGGRIGMAPSVFAIARPRPVTQPRNEARRSSAHA
jgi:2-polyprenyl-3-methyl-5-hydroxy-6-metoxy-1,4-benzoquinol methylase